MDVISIGRPSNVRPLNSFRALSAAAFLANVIYAVPYEEALHEYDDPSTGENVWMRTVERPLRSYLISAEITFPTVSNNSYIMLKMVCLIMDRTRCPFDNIIALSDVES